MFRKMMYLTTLLIAVLALSACGANISINPFTAEETVTQSFTASAPGGGDVQRQRRRGDRQR